MRRKAITSVALPGRAGGHALALQVGQLRHALAVDADHVHAVRVQHHQRAHADLAGLELVVAAVGVERRVGHRQADVGLAAADELEVVDRAAGHLGGGLHAGHVLGEHRGHAAAHRVVHAARAAGGDGDVLRRGRQRQRGQADEGAEEAAKESDALHARDPSRQQGVRTHPPFALSRDRACRGPVSKGRSQDANHSGIGPRKSGYRLSITTAGWQALRGTLAE
jgi:hypothetical protein